MATGTKDTRKVWESLPLEMRWKPKKCAGKKREKTAEAATEAVSTTGKGRMVGKVSEKEKNVGKKRKEKKPQRTAAEAKEDSSSSSSRGFGGVWGVQKGSSDGVWQMGRSEGVVG
jgi:hypothetical protein